MKARAQRRWTGFGPGKVILLGEHAVVYGQPALAAPLPWGVTAHATPAAAPRLELPPSIKGERRRMLQRAFARAARMVQDPAVSVRLESDLPVSMGLGSSAAVSVACARVLLAARGRRPEAPAVLKVAWAMEREFHGTPSGIDHHTSARGALIRFTRSESGVTVRPVRCPRPLKLLVALVGERSGTKETVAALRSRVRRWPGRYRRLFDQVGLLADEGRRAIERGDFEALGDLMNVNQGLLSALGLSSTRIEELLYRLRGLGAWGAKLTGAGGDGGAVIALFPEPHRVLSRLVRQGVFCFASQIAGPPEL